MNLTHNEYSPPQDSKSNSTNININGRTEVYGLLGDPVAHTFSPQIHHAAARLLGQNIAYLPFHVKPAALADAVKGAHALGIQGLNVTIPHKQAVMESVIALDESAQLAGAVNTLQYTDDGYVGHNTDVPGLSASLALNGVDIRGKDVILIGASGSANAAALTAAQNEARSLTIVNRTKPRAQSLKEHINTFYPIPIQVVALDDITSLRRGDVVIQSSAVGFGAEKGRSPLPDTSFFQQVGAQAAVDLIYTPWKTRFLEQAEESGLPIAVNGFDMLVFQALRAYEIWRGVLITAEDKRRLRDALQETYCGTIHTNSD